MEELTAPPASPKTDAEYEAAVDALLAEMQQMDEKSARTWEEIERHGWDYYQHTPAEDGGGV